MARRTATLLRRLLVATLTVITLGAASATPAIAHAQDATCETTVRGASEIEVCLEQPANPGPIREDTVFSATVDLKSDDLEVRSVEFRLSGTRALTDFDPPYRFTLPVSYWPDGAYTLDAIVRTSDGEKSNPASMEITLASGQLYSFVTRSTFAPVIQEPPPGTPLIVAAVGDAAGGSPESAAVSTLIRSWDPALLLYLGDVYNSGTYTEYINWYDPPEYFGALRDITLPTIGNHEYGGADVPKGYMEYWGNPPHHYSVDVAGWHIVSLDSNSRFAQVTAGTQQMQWLEDDLAASPAACTLVFFHHPPHSVGSYANENDLEELWNLLADQNVTLVLTGHDHNYQRWQRMDGDAKIAADGTASLVVGTGGQSTYAIKEEDERLAAPSATDPGAVRLELNPNGAAFQFITTGGVVRDSDVIPCAADDSASDTTPPQDPANGSAAREQDGNVLLAWEPATDDTGVSEYQVFRDEAYIGSATPGATYIDEDAPSSAVRYRISAVDASGNASSGMELDVPAGDSQPGVLFADSFESRSLEQWDKVDGLTVESSSGENGQAGWVARAHASVHPAYARVDAPDSPEGLQVRVRFKVIEQGDNPIVLLRLRSEDGGSLLGINIAANGTLGRYNDVVSDGVQSPQAITAGTWHTLTVAVTGSPGNTMLQVSLDDAPVEELSGPIDLGNSRPHTIQLGDSAPDRIYDLLFDDFAITTPAAATPEPTPVSSVAIILASSLGAWAHRRVRRPECAVDTSAHRGLAQSFEDSPSTTTQASGNRRNRPARHPP